MASAAVIRTPEREGDFERHCRVLFADLAGFTAVYDNDSAMTFEQLTQENSTENALEQVLQDRAEALRRQLDGTTPPADGATSPADGTTPPADGTTPPAEGTTPPATPAAPQ